MKLLIFIFLAIINAKQLNYQNIDSLLNNGIRGLQCGDPIGSRKRSSTLVDRPCPRPCPRPRPYRLRRHKRQNKVTMQMIKIYPGDKNGGFESCTADSFTLQKNGALPSVTVEGFYVPNYGAGKVGPQQFDPNKNYIGFIIMAIYGNGRWYIDHSRPFVTTNVNPVDGKTYKARIKPGYILMNEAEYLTKHHGERSRTSSFHSKLFQDFAGKDQATLEKEGVYYIGWGFSYQKTDSRTNALFCDFKDNSTTFNKDVIDIPNVGLIPVLENPMTKLSRDSGKESLPRNLTLSGESWKQNPDLQ